MHWKSTLVYKMESLNQRKRKSKGKWFSNSKKAKYSICPGQRGFLVFCNNKEKEAIKEARILFDEYLPKFNDDTTEIEPEDKDEENQESGDDFDEAESEVKEMKETKEKDDSCKLMNSGVQNVLFFKTKLKNPVGFALSILDDIQETQQQKTRFLMRFIPIEATCKAHKENFEMSVKKLLVKHFENISEVKTYSVIFKARCNNDFTKDLAIRICGDVIKEMDKESKAKVEYKNPDLVIMVEVMKGNICLGILPKYFNYKKYNLIELANVTKAETKQDESSDRNVNE